MTKRLVVLPAIVSLLTLLLAGCGSGPIMPKSPYFGVDHTGKRHVPAELHEVREIE